jgi:acyl transferase domain-containing protein/long-subunit acyl-CoA synthetase (AMP-forming)/surfactin synthase thioesterase subunit/NAD(P)-dependent dehydrogenase (short-subunit alcohol dehydrogenase family)
MINVMARIIKNKPCIFHLLTNIARYSQIDAIDKILFCQYDRKGLKIYTRHKDMTLLTLEQMILQSEKNFGSTIALQMWNQDKIDAQLTYTEFVREIRHKTDLLKKAGLKEGDRIGIISSNSLEWAVAFFAIQFCLATAVAIDSQYSGPDAIPFIQGIDLQFILTTRELFSKFSQKYLTGLPSVFDLQNEYKPLYLNEKKKMKINGDPAIALICFTSGSTGTPKGIMLDHQCLVTNALNSAKVCSGNSHQRGLLILPLSHVIGLCSTLLAPLSCGATITMINELKGDIILKALQGTKTTILIAVPRLFEILYLKIMEKINQSPPRLLRVFKALLAISWFGRKYLGLNLGRIFFRKVHRSLGGSIQLFLSGGAAMDPKVWKGLMELGFTTMCGYGLSETTGPITGNDLKDISIGTAGKRLWAEIKCDEAGEIWVKGKTLFRGYFGRPDLTAEAIKDGWFRTGDLGYFTPDENLVITGRVKELIVLQSGQKAIPDEVDRYYAQLAPIEDFASFGVPISPGSTCDTIHTAVVIAKGFDEAQATKAIEERGRSIPTHLRVSSIHFIDKIPRTLSMKIKRMELRKQFEKPPEIHLSSSEKEDETKKIVLESIRYLLQLPPNASLDESKGFFELGFDSLMATELVARLQEKIGAAEPIPVTILFEHSNIASLTRYLRVLQQLEPPKPEPERNEASTDCSIAIVGMSCRLPGGANNLKDFWELLEKGKDGTSEAPESRFKQRFGLKRGGFLAGPVDEFDASFFGITPREAALMDPQQRLLLELIWESLEEGGIPPDSLRATKTGVFIGASSHDYVDLLSQNADISHLNGYWGTGNAASVLAGRISYFLGAQGPCMTVDTACSSSLAAIHYACKSLSLNESNMALAGGINLILSPFPSIVFSEAKMLSSDGKCKTFDAGANGYARGEGGGVLVLKRLSDALRDKDRIFATIEATALNQDGASGGLTVPNGGAQISLIKEALLFGNLRGSDIDYVEAHGTGTSLGDPIEVRALSAVLGKNRETPLYLGSVKTNIGHLEAAAGVAGLIKVVLSLMHEKIPPHLNLKTLNPLIDLKSIPAIIPTEAQSWPRNKKRVRYGSVSSFGFSGTNGHAILKEAPLIEEKETVEEKELLITISAKSEKALDQLIKTYEGFLEKDLQTTLADIAFTTHTGRNHFQHKLTFAAKSKEELLEKLRKRDSTDAKYKADSGKKISLPLYPFQRQRYWADHLLENSHPLLGKRRILPKGESQYEGKFIDSFFLDHKIMDLSIFPASGYIEMIIAVGKDHWQGETLSIEQFVISEMLEIVEGIELLTLVSPQPNGSLKISIYSKKSGSSWREHATATVQKAQPIPSSSLQALCTEEIDPVEFYRLFDEQGFEYGPHFQKIYSLKSGKMEALGNVKIEPSSRYFFHPALLDACFQVIGAALPSSTELWLPVGIDQFTLNIDQPAELIVHAKVHLPDSVDLDLFSPSGEIVGSIKGFKLKKAPKPNSNEKLTFQPVWLHEPLSQTSVVDPDPFLVVDATSFANIEGKQEVVYLCNQVEELLSLMKILIDKKEFPPLAIVTKRIQPLKDRAIDLEGSPLTGMIRTFALEVPHIRVRHIDLGEENFDLLRSELQNGKEDQVAYVENKRYVCRLLKPTDVAKAESKLIIPNSLHYQLQIAQKGSLTNLTVQPVAFNKKLENSEIAIRVEATGLNFRDVLNALGLYPGDAGALGGECAGIVTRVGPSVKDIRIGDAVAGFASGSFASDVLSDERFVFKKPDHFSFSKAASLPIVFLTAYYSLIHLAKLKPKQKVLIHAASGGVGLAAIQIAKQAGAIIYATAGNETKREYLKKLGIDHIYDSRKTTFAEEILQSTGGTGVDVVLNSLSGKGFIEKTVSCTVPSAVFLEIGKRDIWSAEEMKRVRADLSYFVIALDDLIANQPDFVRKLIQEMIPYLSPLPVTKFSLSQSILAFQYMQQAKHIGKIVIEKEPSIRFDSDGSYLITGGFGALGLQAAHWLAANGAKHICLVGRKKPTEWPKLKNAQVECIALDIQNKEALFTLIHRFGKELPSLKGVIHAAGVLDDGLIQEQTMERFQKTFGPKALGALYLHEATQNLNLDFFILFSSIASLIGSPGQLNYAAANSYLDALAMVRKQKGLPALSIQWGPWGGGGMAKGLEERHKSSGILPLKPKEAFSAMNHSLQRGLSHIAIGDIHWAQFQSRLPKPLSLLSQLLSSQSQTSKYHLKLANLLKKDPRKETIHLFVEEMVRHTIGLSQNEPLDAHLNFYQLGLDSLMAIELRNSLQESIDPATQLSYTLVVDHPSIDALTNHLNTLLIEKTSHETKVMSPFLHVEGVSPFDLYCFPPAGGGPWIFSKWNQMNLRLFRNHAKATQDLKLMIQSIADKIESKNGRPFAFFGHSMGSLVSYEVAKELQRRKHPLPSVLFVASLDAPTSPTFRWPKEKLFHQIQLEYQHSYSKTPEMEQFAATLQISMKQDLDLLNLYTFSNDAPLACPIVVCYGKEDGICSETGLDHWGELTTQPVVKHALAGNHFDLIMNPQSLLSIISKTLASHAAT